MRVNSSTPLFYAKSVDQRKSPISTETARVSGKAEPRSALLADLWRCDHQRLGVFVAFVVVAHTR